MERPSGAKVVIILELFVAFLGIASGLNLLVDPSGRSMGLNVVLHLLPLSDFTLLGVWLFSVYGVLPILLSLGLWMGRILAWRGALILAGVEIIWVTGQTYWVGLHVLQGIIGAVAVTTTGSACVAPVITLAALST